MKLKELRIPSDRKLFEDLSKDNDTGLASEDLVKIVKTDMEDNWLPGVTYEEYLKEEETEYRAWLSSQGKSN
jgi:hypothetical protein